MSNEQTCDHAKIGTLPDRYGLCCELDDEVRSLAYYTIENLSLPKDSKYWKYTYKSGRTIAHEAARKGCLPKDFDQWELADNEGRTVAHEAAVHDNLPKDFDQWELADCYGLTVAHVAVGRNALPKSFNQWELCDDQSTVALEKIDSACLHVTKMLYKAFV